MRNSALAFLAIMVCSCDKLVSISDPVDQITTDKAFSSNELATLAMNGVYSSMILKSAPLTKTSAFGSLSADDVFVTVVSQNPEYYIGANRLFASGETAGTSPTDGIWKGFYAVIYNANAVIEGIANSASAALTDSVKKQTSAQAKCLRAFCYFYLTNFYGDVPLLLSTDYDAGMLAHQSPKAEVYRQIIQDLSEAKADLPADYAFSQNNRTRVNKWAATALLARVYLYTKNYAGAAAEATAVINNSALYSLEPDLSNIFLIPSREAIWQLNQMGLGILAFNSTPDGESFLPERNSLRTGPLTYGFTAQLLNAFEQGDRRRQKWVDSSTYSLGSGNVTYFFSHKYKIGRYNRRNNGVLTEYFMMLRLAEQYLIRAEASANGAPGGSAAAIADLNAIRRRAGLPDLPDGLPQPELLAAVAREWQTEFFCEWAHRWFNLKRTEKAHDVLSAIPLKQPWAGDHQLLYPIPFADILYNKQLVQNPGY